MGKKDYLENLTSLNHNLNNVLGIIESSMNLLKNADLNNLGKRWTALRDALITTGRERLNREIDLFRNTEKKIENVHKETLTAAYNQLLNADKNYKTMYDRLFNSTVYTDETKNTTFDYGHKTVHLLKRIIDSLEEIRIEMQKI